MSTLPSASARRSWPWVAGVTLLLAGAGLWWWFSSSSRSGEAEAKRAPAPIMVVTARAEARDVPVRLKANGSVTAVQSVDLRSQVTSTVAQMHIREGQDVRKGDLLFSLDARADEANIRKAQAQVEKDRADLASSMRSLDRQKELFRTKFISQAALDAAQNQVDTLNGQLAVDQAALESARVSRGYMEIRAPFAGRTGAIGVRPGSLVQPGATATALVTVTQIDPIQISFTLPEKELPGLQQALTKGAVMVTAVSQSGSEEHKGRITFIDNAVDTTTGTIRVKAEFANPKASLWPGMYANVELAPRTIAGAVVIPAQAVQTGPESRFVYVVGEDRKVASRKVNLTYVDTGMAVVDGLAAGARVVVEGAHNLRPGSTVAEAGQAGRAEGKGDEKGQKQGKGAKKGEAK